MFKKNFMLKILCAFSYTLLPIKSNLVNTTTGLVRGKLNHYRKISYYSYEGIPFAQPPIGDLRFRPPVPIKPWKNVLDATAPGSVCPQNTSFYHRYEMDEDCLYLNIYVPVTVPVEHLAVVFVIHGGYYTFYSGKPEPIYGPQLMLGKGLIVVTTNYRLGALGFLAFDDIQASGNAGLKDILLASRWVKSNIVKFGGNPNQICIYGTGSSGALAHYILLTKQSSGIFNTAIICSGSAISYRALQVNPKKNALKLARQLGIEYNDSRCLSKLKEIDAFEIVDAQTNLIANDPRIGFFLVNLFSPAIEKPSPIALITKHPLDIIRSDGLVQKIPVIIGFNNQEGLEIFDALKYEPNIVNILNKNFELCIPPNINYPPKSQERRDLAKAIREFYFNGRNIDIFNTQNYINLITDSSYAYGIDYWVKLYRSQKSSSPVYYYFFQFDGELNWVKLVENITYPGACRADELGYIFFTNATENKLQNLNTKSQYVLESLLSIFKNFATTGNPTPPRPGSFQWIETDQNRSHIVIDNTIYTVNEPPLRERLRFWYKEYAKYYAYGRNKRGYV